MVVFCQNHTVHNVKSSNQSVKFFVSSHNTTISQVSFFCICYFR